MIPYEIHKFIFGIPVYMIMYWIGWFSAFIFILNEGKRVGIKTKKMAIIFFSAVISVPLMARVFFFIGPWKPLTLKWYYVFNFRYDGYVQYGGVIGGILALIITSKLMKQNFWQILDITAMSAVIGLFFGRVGCFFAGCCYGKAAEVLIALDNGKTSRYPTQIFSAFYNLLIFTFLNIMKYKKRFNGQIFALFLITISSFRFIEEIFRSATLYYGLTASQWISILLFISGLITYYNLGKKIKSI
jgi:phosphatidylglycerol---prolipoprotein diacylglyceryl transferase